MNCMSKKFVAELIGTFWLVFGGCGAAVFAGDQIHYAGISLAFGLTVLTGAYAFGHVSGGHFNPAVSFGLWAAGRFDKKELVPYIIAQLIGAVIAGLAMWAIQAGRIVEKVATSETTTQVYHFAENGYCKLSPANYGMGAAILAELILTFIFLVVICGATDKCAPQGMAPAAIGLCLTLIHLIGIPVTNLSVNPARSFGPALLQQIANHNCDALSQLWLFIVFPIVGAVLAGWLYKAFLDKKA